MRWAGFLLSALILAAIYVALNAAFPDGISQFELKRYITQASVNTEYLPAYFWPLIFIGTTGFFLLGLPSIIVFCPVYLLKGFVVAFSFTVLTQSFASLVAVFYSRKKNLEEAIPSYVMRAIKSSDCTPQSLCFWGRIYLSFPHRTIDLLTAAILGEKTPVYTVFIDSLLGTMIRFMIPAIWATTWLDYAREVFPVVKFGSDSFLVWSSILLAYLVVPKIPELMICKSNLKPVLEQIENWEKPVGDAATMESRKRGRSRIKLGMQSRINQTQL
ncbi:MAG: hypothetical protein Kow0029_06280 [Candidatus Rifleibacteriota bacterium]